LEGLTFKNQEGRTNVQKSGRKDQRSRNQEGRTSEGADRSSEGLTGLIGQGLATSRLPCGIGGRKKRKAPEQRATKAQRAYRTRASVKRYGTRASVRRYGTRASVQNHSNQHTGS